MKEDTSPEESPAETVILDPEYLAAEERLRKLELDYWTVSYHNGYEIVRE